jgi:hypothetical protein
LKPIERAAETFATNDPAIRHQVEIDRFETCLHGLPVGVARRAGIRRVRTMQWLLYFLWPQASAATVGASDGATVIAFRARSNRRRGGRGFWQRLFGGTDGAPRRRHDRSRLSAMSHHVLRDIGMSPTEAQFKGLRIDWRP